MSKFVKKSLAGKLLGLDKDDKEDAPLEKKSPDELAASAEAAEERKRRGALGRASTIRSGTLGAANVGARLLSGK